MNNRLGEIIDITWSFEKKKYALFYLIKLSSFYTILEKNRIPNVGSADLVLNNKINKYFFVRISFRGIKILRKEVINADELSVVNVEKIDFLNLDSPSSINIGSTDFSKLNTELLSQIIKLNPLAFKENNRHLTFKNKNFNISVGKIKIKSWNK